MIERLSQRGPSLHQRWLQCDPLLLLVVIVGFSFVLRLAIIVLSRTYQYPELFEHEDIARNILQGRGFVFPHLGQDYLSMRPLFVYLCLVVYWLSGWSHLWMLVVQSLTSTVLVAIVFQVSRIWTSPTGALLASALTAFHPALVMYDTRKIHPLSVQALLIALVFLAIVSLLKGPSRWGFARVGLLSGLAFYERGPVIAALLSGLLFVWCTHRMKFWEFLRGGLIVGIVFIAVLSPWAIRNFWVYGRPVLIMTATWELLWIGNHPGATGAGYGPGGEASFSLAPRDFQERVLREGELGQQGLFRAEVLQFLRLRPAAAIRLFFMKLFYFWWFSPISGFFYPAWYLPLYKAVYGVLLALAILGVALATRATGLPRIAPVTIAAALFAMSMMQSAFFVEGRHRMVIEPLLFTLAAGGISGRLVRREWP